MASLDFIQNILSVLGKRKPEDVTTPAPRYPVQAFLPGEREMFQNAPPPNGQGAPPMTEAMYAGNLNGLGSTPPVDEATRDRIVDLPPPMSPPPALPPRAALEAELSGLNKKYNKGVYFNPDDPTGETTNNPNKPGFTGVKTAPGKDRDTNWSVWDKVKSALAGWAEGGLAGGIAAGTDRNYFEKMGDENQRARLLPQIAAQQKIDDFNSDERLKAAQTQKAVDQPILAREQLKQKVATEKGRFDRQTKALEARAKAEGGKWKPYVDENGRRWKQFTNDPNAELEPIIDPNTREQDIDPSAQLYDWVDPTSGQTVKIKGSQLANAGATIASGNATRLQGAETTNVNNALEASRANLTAQTSYQKQENDLFLQEAEALSKADNIGYEAQGAITELQKINEQIAEIQASPAMRDEPEKVLKTVSDLQVKAAALQGKILESSGKSESGKLIAKRITEARGRLQKPTPIVAGKVKAARVTVPRSKDPLGLFQ